MTSPQTPTPRFDALDACVLIFWMLRHAGSHLQSKQKRAKSKLEIDCHRRWLPAQGRPCHSVILSWVAWGANFGAIPVFFGTPGAMTERPGPVMDPFSAKLAAICSIFGTRGVMTARPRSVIGCHRPFRCEFCAILGAPAGHDRMTE